MRKVLIIEDNETKLERIMDLCSTEFPSYSLVDKRSYNSAQQEVLFHGNEYDLILLDVSMNTYEISIDDNGEQEPLAGSKILRFMKLRKINTPVIVVTMYESFVDGVKIKALDSRFKTQYNNIYKGYIYYNVKTEDWKVKLITMIKSLGL